MQDHEEFKITRQTLSCINYKSKGLLGLIVRETEGEGLGASTVGG